MGFDVEALKNRVWRIWGVLDQKLTKYPWNSWSGHFASGQLAKATAWWPKTAKNAFFSFATCSQVANDSWKTLTLIFQHKNKLETLKNKVSTKLKNKEWRKTLPNTNKMIKNLFGLIHIYDYTHITFKHAQLHKWNRHSLNIRLVCCMGIKYELVHSLVWRFNDQFNQVIHK